MKLYNTLSKKNQKVIPISEDRLRIYSCGPTVYSHAHIGNLASHIFADTLRRVTGQTGFETLQVINLTDVDDKTIGHSKKIYPNLEPRLALEKLTTQFSQMFFEDMQKIGNDINAVTFVRATDHIEAMKQLITGLLEKGFAYTTDDGVYFSIESYQRSGKTYGQLLNLTAKNTSRARIDNDEYDKDNIHDFALWKVQKKGEPAWDFSYKGKNINGRPGWHLECSALSRQILGQPFDIHTGGIDLIFPHHENEIAQSTAGEKDPKFASIFAHNEHMLVDGKKMSKSLNNFFVLDDVVKKGFHPLAFRLLILQSHYRTQSNFTWGNLEAAQNRLQDLQAWADLRHQPSTNIMPKTLDFLFRDTRQEMQKAMGDDLNTPAALSSLSKLASAMMQIPIPSVEGKYTDGTLGFIDHLLGLDLDGRPDISKEQKSLIVDREKSRKQKNWEKSDELRQILEKQGIGLRDTPHGQIWHRQTVL